MQFDLLGEEPNKNKIAAKPSSKSKIKEKPTYEPDLFGGLPILPPPEKKSPTAFKTISETAVALEVPAHVLRFWESRFSQIKPLKMGGGRRYYRPEDIDILSKIKNLLYKQGYTIKGAKKAFSIVSSEQDYPIEETTGIILTEQQKYKIREIYIEMLGLREELRPYLS